MTRTAKILIAMLLMMGVLIGSVAAIPDIGLNVSNITNNDIRCGVFDLTGVVVDPAQVSRIMVKAGNGPWEQAQGVSTWKYTVNSRQLVLKTQSVFDSELGKSVKIYQRGTYYGDLAIQIQALNAKDTVLDEETLHVLIYPEAPYSSFSSGTLAQPIDVDLKAASDTTILFTTDGTDPATSPTKVRYNNSSIHVSADTTIRAIAQSQSGLNSEELVLNLKINLAEQPAFFIQYYEDINLSRLISDTPYLGSGIYYLKITANKALSSPPSLSIDAPGYKNDLSYGSAIRINDNEYRFARTITADNSAVGDSQEIIRISGNFQGTSLIDELPQNAVKKAAYIDTAPPGKGSISSANGTSINDPTPLLHIGSTGATQMRLAPSEAGLANALWVDYAEQYDAFDISAGGNGNKTIWVEFKDRAGNVQTQHASTVVNYNNAVFSLDIEYFEDSGFTRSLGNNPYLKTGIYYLKITTNQDLDTELAVEIRAQNNDSDGFTTQKTPRIFSYTRTIGSGLTDGVETIKIGGQDPSNKGTKTAYIDTIAPSVPVIVISDENDHLKPIWSWSNSGADRYRYRFTGSPEWMETTQTSFTPENNLTLGTTYTLEVQAGDRAGNWSGSASKPFTITAPLINITQNSNVIPAGTGTYGFGSALLNSNSDVTFVIHNNGTAALNLTDFPKVRISGLDVASFSVAVQPSLSTIAAGDSTTFTVRFNPISIGGKTATVSVITNDSARSPYTFVITGTGIAPEIAVMQGGVTIPRGSSYDFGNTLVSSSNDYEFTVYNPGTADLTLSTPQISGADAASFSIVTQPATTVAAQGSTTFKVRFAPTSNKAMNATVSIINNVDMNPFTFNLQGTGTIILEPIINVKQGATDIAPGSGSYDFGNVLVNSSADVTFSIQNKGTSDLTLSAPQISGTDAASFSIITQPDATVAAKGSTTFTVRFAPKSSKSMNAAISISNNDTETPYTFAIAGTGVEPIISLKQGETGIAKGGSYSFGNVLLSTSNSAIFTVQNIGTTDLTLNAPVISGDSSFSITGNPAVTVTPGGSTSFTVVYTPTVSGAKSATVSIASNDADMSPFTFTVRGTGIEPIINVAQASTTINNNGTYSFGSVKLFAPSSVTFTIQNSGSAELSLTGSSPVVISGTNAALFSVTTQPATTVAANGSTTFTIKFNPDGTGSRSATVTIANNDPDKTPYTFTITGTGAVDAALTLGSSSWTNGTFAAAGETKVYSFNATKDSMYGITWAEAGTTGYSYTANVQVAIYGPNLSTPYQSGLDSSPVTTFARDNIIYIKVTAVTTGTFGIKAYLNEPIMSVKQSSTAIPNGGSYSFGNVSILSSGSTSFTISNTGPIPLSLNGSSRVEIGGTNASCFKVTVQPSATVASTNGTTTFTISFTPDGTGSREAKVSIANNDSDQNPYTFKVTGTGTGTISTLTVGTSWTSRAIPSTGVLVFSFSATAGKKYMIAWDDASDGTGSYRSDVKVTAYKKDMVNTYFTDIDKGYTSPQVITAADDTVYIKVSGSYDLNNFALRAVLNEPVITVKQSSTIASGGSYNFGSFGVLSNVKKTFTIQNTGVVNLNLTGTPLIKLSGDTSDFTVTTQPYGTAITPGNSATFDINFNPTAGAGTKTATVTIASNDPANSSYSFTITGTATLVPISLPLETVDGHQQVIANDCIQQAGVAKIYAVSVVPGKTYQISWLDDNADGLGQYNLDVAVSAYHKDLTTPYFIDNYVDTPPSQTIKAVDDTIYIRVWAESIWLDYPENNYYQLAVQLIEPIMSLKKGDTDMPNGGSYDFGKVRINQSSPIIEFTIHNSGTGDLILTDPRKIWLSVGEGGNETDLQYFTLVNMDTSTIKKGENWYFTVKFSPIHDLIGTKTVTVNIATNDPNHAFYTFTVTGTGALPRMKVTQAGTVIPSGSGKFDFGHVAVSGYKAATFTIENPGNDVLHISLDYWDGDTVDQDGAYLYRTGVIPSSIEPGSSANFTVFFSPTDLLTKTATLSIDNDATDTYTITFTGAGALDSVSLEKNTLTPGTISAGEVQYYSFTATPGEKYTITWEDNGKGNTTGDIAVTAYDPYLSEKIFTDAEFSPQVITIPEGDYVILLKVVGKTAGTFAIKAGLNVPDIRVTQGSGDVTSYNFGFVGLDGFGQKNPGFDIINAGNADLHLLHNPIVEFINQTDPSLFSISDIDNNDTTLVPGTSDYFTLHFTPTTGGAKSATAVITSDDPDEYQYKIFLQGYVVAQYKEISSATDLGTPRQGEIVNNGDEVIYELHGTKGLTYTIEWTGNVVVSAYQSDAMTEYFEDSSRGSETITAQEDDVFILVSGLSTGTFTVKVN